MAGAMPKRTNQRRPLVLRQTLHHLVVEDPHDDAASYNQSDD